MRKVMLGVLTLVFLGAISTAWLSSTNDAPVGSNIGDVTLADDTPTGAGTSGIEASQPQAAASPKRPSVGNATPRPTAGGALSAGPQPEMIVAGGNLQGGLDAPLDRGRRSYAASNPGFGSTNHRQNPGASGSGGFGVMGMGGGGVGGGGGGVSSAAGTAANAPAVASSTATVADGKVLSTAPAPAPPAVSSGGGSSSATPAPGGGSVGGGGGGEAAAPTEAPAVAGVSDTAPLGDAVAGVTDTAPLGDAVAGVGGDDVAGALLEGDEGGSGGDTGAAGPFGGLAAPSPAPTPEPTTMLLLGTGLAGLYKLRRYLE